MTAHNDDAGSTAGGAAGRRVVVAGASSAAGRSVCAALVAASAHVIAVGSDAGRLQAVSASETHVADLQNRDEVDALAATIGAVDGVVHLVGGWKAGREDDDWVDLEGRILHTLRNVTSAFEPALSASSDARLVIVSSTAVDAPTWGNANYATIKAAAETWVGALARRWRDSDRAAAVILVVRALGDSGTPVATLGATIAALWDTPATALNGARMRLSGTGE